MTEASRTLAGLIERGRSREAEFWKAIGEDWDAKALAVSHLVEIVFALTEEQIEKMDAGLTLSDFSEDQRRRFALAEPPLRKFGWIGEATLEAARIQIMGNGGFRFLWTSPSRTASINWLPYSWSRSHAIEADELKALLPEKEEIIRRHYADFRQGADCCRMAFALALTLSSDQIAAASGNPGLSCSQLQPGQLALLKAFGRLYPGSALAGIESGFVIYEASGQFWSLSQDAESGVVHQYGVGWLPSVAHGTG